MASKTIKKKVVKPIKRQPSPAAILKKVGAGYTGGKQQKENKKSPKAQQQQQRVAGSPYMTKNPNAGGSGKKPGGTGSRRGRPTLRGANGRASRRVRVLISGLAATLTKNQSA